MNIKDINSMLIAGYEVIVYLPDPYSKLEDNIDLNFFRGKGEEYGTEDYRIVKPCMRWGLGCPTSR